jgi:hypothetical protein
MRRNAPSYSPNRMVSNIRFLLIIAFVGFFGFGAMYMLTYLLPLMEHNNLNYGLFALAIIAVGLTVPYVMLKLSLHEAHLKNPREKELKLADIPKSQQVMKRKTKHK